MEVIISLKWHNLNRKFIIMSDRLEFLKRKHREKARLNNYKKIFKIFNFLEWYDLEDTDSILEKLQSLTLITKNEFLKEGNNFIESVLLRETYLSANESSLSYIFTDDYEYCGIFLVY